MAWEERGEPELGPGQALVDIAAVGVCGSDVHGYAGRSGRRQPGLVMGHEASGEVAAVGSGVPPEWIGRRVVIQPILSCGSCDQCRDGHPNRCRHREFLGATMDGAMAERVAVPVTNLLAIPSALSPVHATLVEPLAVAIHAVAQAGDLAGRSLLVAGSGPIGLLILMVAQRRGARVAVTTDVATDRRVLALALGADAALDPSRDDLGQGLVAAAGSAEVDVAFDAVGIQETFEQAMVAARPGGTVLAIGGWQAVQVDLGRLVTRELNVRGTFNYTLDEFVEAMEWLGDGRVDAAALLAEVRALADGPTVFEQMAMGRAPAGKVVLVISGGEV